MARITKKTYVNLSFLLKTILTKFQHHNYEFTEYLYCTYLWLCRSVNTMETKLKTPIFFESLLYKVALCVFHASKNRNMIHPSLDIFSFCLLCKFDLPKQDEGQHEISIPNQYKLFSSCSQTLCKYQSSKTMDHYSQNK